MYIAWWAGERAKSRGTRWHQRTQWLAGDRSGSDDVRYGFELPKAKADALFNLLAPDHVPVLVGRSDDGVIVRGTSDQANVVNDFVALLTRLDHLRYPDRRRSIEHARPTWTTSKTYPLREPQAESLWRLLAFEDVPVLVRRDGPHVRVDATPEDQRIIERLVRIVR